LHCKKTKGNKKHQFFHRRDVAKLNEIRKDNLHGFSGALHATGSEFKIVHDAPLQIHDQPRI
jgi:hypothetical protein